uniref:SUI1 domain-containing protein n=1 Tax=Panagrellus redivivus TaxID=6233 RepID=A0A7E4W2A0_PANRE
MRKLQAAHDVEAVKQCLLQFEAVLRRPVFVNPWWSSLGHTKLLRVTTTDRDKRQALDAKRKKAERELATADINDVSNDIVWVKFNSKKPQNKTILRVKGEQYRVNGKEQKCSDTIEVLGQRFIESLHGGR